MRKIIVSGLMLLAVFAGIVKAQQMPLLNQYIFNKTLFNPAQSYQYDKTELFLLHKSQWSDIPDAPNTQVFTLNSGLKNNKSGAGLLFNHDRIGLWNQVGGYGNYSYAVKLGEEMFLSAGVYLGAFQRSYQFEKVVVKDNTDPQLLPAETNKASFDGAFGINYAWKTLNVGFTAWQIFGSKVSYLDPQRSIVYQVNRHMTANIQYSHLLVEKIGLRIEPSVLLRYITATKGLKISAPFQFDGSLVVDAEKWGWIMLAYKHQYSLSAGIGIHESKQLKIGFSYDFSFFTDVKPYLGNTGELFLSYTFKPSSKAAPQTLY